MFIQAESVLRYWYPNSFGASNHRKYVDVGKIRHLRLGRVSPVQTLSLPYRGLSTRCKGLGHLTCGQECASDETFQIGQKRDDDYDHARESNCVDCTSLLRTDSRSPELACL